MANNCAACDDIREVDPNLLINGIGSSECTSLKNDTGLVASSGHNDCTDLEDLNDCLVKNMATEINSYNACSWKDFMKLFINNLWTTLKAMICAICGIWTNIHNLWTKINCVYGALTKLVNELATTTGGKSFIRYYRDNSGAVGSDYNWSFPTSESDRQRRLEVWMDANVDNPGTKNADRDYIVIISYCCDVHKFKHFDSVQTWYASGDPRNIDLIQKRQGQHPAFNVDSSDSEHIKNYSWPVVTAVLIPKGQHLKFLSEVDDACVGDWYRVHQVTMTWLPINIDSSIDPSDILTC